ncbi:MAG: prolyl oligopeptidase family serine peptidase, partial [Candidatus Acidiferrales bacterium]
ESFTEPIKILRYSEVLGERTLWAKRLIPFDSSKYGHTRVWYTSKDGTKIPMFLVGRHEILESGVHPTVMTSYGGYGVSMTPQFSVFVAFLAERGCLFALPSVRGGAEYGAEWHNAARRRNRQTAYDDFVGAADWLVQTGRSTPTQLAIFGGSNSGLLVGVALTQRPDLFRAVVCMAPLLDMLRYHLFDNAHVWCEEYGTADDPDDFAVLYSYSPYHRVRHGTSYPATMIVSGDSDQNCNPLHARKMTARLQTANASRNPILLEYNKHRGHSPVLPLSDRIDGLTDRMAFLCDQLQLPE